MMTSMMTVPCLQTQALHSLMMSAHGRRLGQSSLDVSSCRCIWCSWRNPDLPAGRVWRHDVGTAAHVLIRPDSAAAVHGLTRGDIAYSQQQVCYRHPIQGSQHALHSRESPDMVVTAS